MSGWTLPLQARHPPPSSLRSSFQARPLSWLTPPLLWADPLSAGPWGDPPHLDWPPFWQIPPLGWPFSRLLPLYADSLTLHWPLTRLTLHLDNPPLGWAPCMLLHWAHSPSRLLPAPSMLTAALCPKIQLKQKSQIYDKSGWNLKS